MHCEAKRMRGFECSIDVWCDATCSYKRSQEGRAPVLFLIIGTHRSCEARPQPTVEGAHSAASPQFARRGADGAPRLRALERNPLENKGRRFLTLDSR